MTLVTADLALPHTDTFDDWSSLGRRLCLGHRTLNWLIGDWLIDGSERYGDKARDEARDIFRLDVERFAPIVDTCRAFPEPKRHSALTFGHHLAVMAKNGKGAMTPLPDADRLLREAEHQTLTVAALRAHVRVTTDRQATFIDDDPVDAAYRRIVQAWNLASRAARQLFVESVEECHMGVIEL